MADASSNVPFNRRSPLHEVMRQGRFGNPLGAPGIVLHLYHPIDIVSLMAKPGKTASLKNALKGAFKLSLPGPGRSDMANGMQIHWAAADQWLVMRECRPGSSLFDELAAIIKDKAALSDQSHGRVVISASGARVREVLAKGTAVDLHPDAFAIGACAATQMAHIGVHLARVSEDGFELCLFRGFAENFWEWLTEMSLEVGYQVN